MNQKVVLYLCLATLCGTLSAGWSQGTEQPAAPALPQLSAGSADKPVAKVNGDPISEAAFLTVLAARYGGPCLSDLIENLIIKQAAAKAGVTVDAEEVLRRYVNTERMVETRAPITGENFDMWLAQRALTRDSFRTELYYQMLVENMVADQVKIEPKQVADFYAANKEQLREPAMVRVAHICVATEEEARKLKAAIVQGQITWEEAAKQHSLDPWTKDNGGDMGFLEDSGTPFHRAAFALAANGDISDPVQTRMGFHLLKRLAYKQERIPPFEEIEETLRQRLEARTLANLSGQKRAELMRAAQVEVLQQMPREPSPVAPAAAPAQ